MKYFIYSLALLCITTSAMAQVESLDYLLDYNCDSNLYEMKIKIREGSATQVNNRAQFNSQISIVVPTGDTIEIIETFAPLQNNQNYEGTIPTDWKTIAPALSPGASPENDFYAIVPTLAPAAMYNDLEEDQEVLLFSLKIGDDNAYDERIRFYNNAQDPGPGEMGMGGGNFRNGFIIGNSGQQLYQGNLYRSCVSGIDNSTVLEAKAYPNPFSNDITVDCEDKTSSITIYDMFGACVLLIEEMESNTVTINSSFFTRGIYYIKINSHKGDRVERLVKY